MAKCISPLNGAMPRNPKQFTEGEDARSAGQRGGFHSGVSRRLKRELKEQLIILLEAKCPDGSDRIVEETVAEALIAEALKGNVHAFVTIRDTVGEKPADKVDLNSRPDLSALDALFDAIAENGDPYIEEEDGDDSP